MPKPTVSPSSVLRCIDSLSTEMQQLTDRLQTMNAQLDVLRLSVSHLCKEKKRKMVSQAASAPRTVTVMTREHSIHSQPTEDGNDHPHNDGVEDMFSEMYHTPPRPVRRIQPPAAPHKRRIVDFTLFRTASNADDDVSVTESEELVVSPMRREVSLPRREVSPPREVREVLPPRREVSLPRREVSLPRREVSHTLRYVAPALSLATMEDPIIADVSPIPSQEY